MAFENQFIKTVILSVLLQESQQVYGVLSILKKLKSFQNQGQYLGVAF